MSEETLREKWARAKAVCYAYSQIYPSMKTRIAYVEHVLDDLSNECDRFPVSSTLDRLLDSRFDMAAEAEADLGEIEHKGEKVMVKIKVVRGE